LVIAALAAQLTMLQQRAEQLKDARQQKLEGTQQASDTQRPGNRSVHLRRPTDQVRDVNSNVVQCASYLTFV
jgi:hypothetical protein